MQKSKVLISAILFTFLSFQLTLAHATGEESFRQHMKSLIKKQNFHPVKKKNLYKLWNKLNKTGYVKQKGADLYLRQLLVPMQSMIESDILEGLKNGSIKRVVVVIHTPTPSTPLRLKEAEIPVDLIPSSERRAKNIQETLLIRHTTLLGILAHQNATVVAVYLDSIPTSKIAGYHNYQELLTKYQNLINKPVKTLEAEYQGATYLIEDDSGAVIAFSLSAPQLGSPPKQIWEMWFGKLDNQNVSKRMVKIDSFLKDKDIDLYHYLHNVTTAR